MKKIIISLLIASGYIVAGTLFVFILSINDIILP